MLDKLFYRSTFSKNLVTLVSGTVVAQAFNFIFSIFLTRLYSPADFGLVSLFISIVSFLTIFSCGKFDVALVAAKTEMDSRKLFSLANAIMMLTGFFILLVVAVICFFSDFFPISKKLYGWLWLLPLSVVFITGTQVYWMWNVKEKTFKGISMVRVGEVLSLGFIAILLKSLAVTGLFLATMASQFLSFTLLAALVFTKQGIRKFIFNFKELKTTFKDYSNFPKINIPQGFLDIFQANAFIIIAASHFTNDVLGFYSLSMRVLQVPMRLIILPISHVFFSEASERYRKGENIYPLVKKTILRSVLFALPIPILLLFFGPFLFGWIFGKEWAEAGIYSSILSLWIFTDLVRAPVAQVASIVGKQSRIFYISLFSNIILFIALLVGVGYFNNPRITFAMISITQSVFAIWIIYAVLKMSKSTNESI